jgi:hypothetical protein
MKIVPGIVLALALCSPAMAGVRYTMHVETDDAGKHTEIIQNSWLQGPQAKILLDEGVNLETEIDAARFGAVAYTLDPAKHVSRVVLESHPSRLPGTVENIVTTKTLEEKGPTVLGHPTIHYQFTSEFEYHVPGDTLKGAITHELWVAKDIADNEVMGWMMFEYQLRKSHGIESLFREVSTLGRGLPLAYDGIARINNGDGNTRIVRIGATVDSIDIVNIDPSVFSATNTYEVVPSATQ